MRKLILTSLLFVSFNSFASVGENHTTDNCKLVNQGSRGVETIIESAPSETVRTNATGVSNVE